jgi:hypothetical protein
MRKVNPISKTTNNNSQHTSVEKHKTSNSIGTSLQQKNNLNRQSIGSGGPNVAALRGTHNKAPKLNMMSGG